MPVRPSIYTASPPSCGFGAARERGRPPGKKAPYSRSASLRTLHGCIGVEGIVGRVRACSGTRASVAPDVVVTPRVSVAPDAERLPERPRAALRRSALTSSDATVHPAAMKPSLRIVCAFAMLLLLGCSSEDESSGSAGAAGASGAAGSTAGAAGASGAAGSTAGAAGAAGAAGEAGAAGAAGLGGSSGDAGVDASLPEDASDDTVSTSDGATKVVATIETSKGSIVLELDPLAAPITVANFRKYADDAFYDGLIFHRVIKDFMIQGGGLDPDMKTKSATYPPIVNEAKTSGLSNVRGTIAMARTSAPNSATTQFFINTEDNTYLDPGDASPDGYAVFGKVVQGMDVVDTIEAVETTTVGMYKDVPVEDVLIASVKVEDK